MASVVCTACLDLPAKYNTQCNRVGLLNSQPVSAIFDFELIVFGYQRQIVIDAVEHTQTAGFIVGLEAQTVTVILG